jgi:hypothetical protein
MCGNEEFHAMVALVKMPMRIGPESWPLPPQVNAFAPAAEPTATDGGAERRMFPRKEIHAEVLTRRLDHSIVAHKAPKLSLAMRDLSLGGLSAISDVALEKGERISVVLPPSNGFGGWDAYGRVIRCEPSALGWRVAVQFEMLPAA